MAGQPIDCDHLDPLIDPIEPAFFLAPAKIVPKSAQFAQRVGMIKDQQFVGERSGVAEIDRAHPSFDLGALGWIEPRPDENAAQGVDVASHWPAVEQCRFDESGAAAHEWVIDGFPRERETFDKKPWQLRLETGPIGDLVEAVCGTLLRGPKFVDECRNREGAAVAWNKGHRLRATASELIEVREEIAKIFSFCDGAWIRKRLRTLRGTERQLHK